MLYCLTREARPLSAVNDTCLSYRAFQATEGWVASWKRGRRLRKTRKRMVECWEEVDWIRHLLKVLHISSGRRLRRTSEEEEVEREWSKVEKQVDWWICHVDNQSTIDFQPSVKNLSPEALQNTEFERVQWNCALPEPRVEPNVQFSKIPEPWTELRQHYYEPLSVFGFCLRVRLRLSFVSFSYCSISYYSWYHK